MNCSISLPPGIEFATEPYLFTEEKASDGLGVDNSLVLNGYRINLFHQTKFNGEYQDSTRGVGGYDNIKLLSIKIDYYVRDYWFLPLQISFAYDDLLGYPGYGEILAGVGIQNRLAAANGFQPFFQVMVGANICGLILKPEIGFNVSLSDYLAIYGQLGSMHPLSSLSGQFGNRTLDGISMSAYSVGVGLTYRFSFLDEIPSH